MTMKDRGDAGGAGPGSQGCAPEPAAQSPPAVSIPIALILRLHDEFVSTADYGALSDTCGRCEGRGYRHGFGEDGHDPDWCNTCGGTGEILDTERLDAAEIAFITARLTPVSPEQRHSLVTEQFRAALRHEEDQHGG